ncbi:protein kinase [Nonomuraea sp. NPDC048826]|uniref:protein kinase domain-containing protein n=1 Tax=Nonomuraea sp. NPDC048826 TaxID=3364347 RepID=UPI0037158B0C
MTLLPLQSVDPLHIGRFRLRGRLGSGGQGIVFLGEDDAGACFAIKVPHPHALTDAETRARFAREMEIARRTAPAFTARVVEAKLEDDLPYIVSEYVEGPSLRDRVERNGPLPPDAVHRLATGLATALSAIHQAGIVHRDVKPDNVLLGPDGPRLIDFGIARLPGGSLTASGQLVGTPLYMAPETFEGQRATAATDVFAWGALVAFAAQGRHAFGGGEIAAVMRRILSEEPDLAQVPESIRPTVAAALAKNPAMRPSAVDLVIRLIGSPATPESGTWVGRKRGKKPAVIISVIAAVAAVGVTLVLVRLVDPGPGQTVNPVSQRADTEVITQAPVDTPAPEPVTTSPATEAVTTPSAPLITTQPRNTPDVPIPSGLKSSGMEAYYEVSEAEHAKKVKSLTARDFRPVSLSITNRGYTALWLKQSGPDFVTAHDLSAEEYRTFWQKWSAKGYQETVATAGPDGQVFASVMERRDGAHMAYFGLTAADLRRRNEEALVNGLIPAWITAYGNRFNVAWVPGDTADWQMTINQTRAQYQKEFDKRMDAGYIPEVATIGTNGLFTAMWRPWNSAFYSYTGLSAEEHVRRREALLAQGFRLARLSATQVGDVVMYSLLATKES